MRLTKLEPGQTMAQIKQAALLDHDCGLVAGIINKRPGIPSKSVIADIVGLSEKRVAECIRRINSNDTPYSRVDYGLKRAKEGPYAGMTQKGWWPPRVAAYTEVMDQADEHSSLVERGVRRSRLMRLAFAKGLSSSAAERTIASIERRLEVQVEELSEADLSAFEALVVAELEV